ncbi:hypothetical protein YC2023_098491 [Brassica napus]
MKSRGGDKNMRTRQFVPRLIQPRRNSDSDHARPLRTFRPPTTEFLQPRSSIKTKPPTSRKMEHRPRKTSHTTSLFGTRK